MNCCNKPNIKDLSQGLSENRHYYCLNCGSHKYDDFEYTKQEWNKYVNGENHDPIRQNNNNREAQSRIFNLRNTGDCGEEIQHIPNSFYMRTGKNND